MHDRTHELSTGWTLSFTHPVTKQRHCMAATVPGNVEIDLQREGLIADPMPPDTGDALRVFEAVDDWLYETTFDALPAIDGGRTELVFEGIDTIADVILNDQPLLRCENMFIPHAADVTGKLKPTGNRLQVRIYSTVLHARKFDYKPSEMAREHRIEQAFIRKARHMWGWDNAPRLVSAGLWRPVCVVVRPPIRFKQVYAYTAKVVDGAAHIGVNWAIETPDVILNGYRGKMLLSFDGRVQIEQDFPIEFTAGVLRRSLPLSEAKLWWPRGFGPPNLYDLQLRIYKDEAVVAEWSSKFGIREISLVRTETTDKKGRGEFVFVCNGEKVYANGTNWKPADALSSRARGERVQRGLEMCLDLNCNMVRVWGGGIYEEDAFYDFCDRHGLLVWQEFMFGCEFPPQEEFLLKAVAHEAGVVIKRLRNHPSIAVWCGDNEDDMTVFWGLLLPPKLLPSHNKITRQVLKDAVATHDPYRDFLESSPYVSDEVARGRWDKGMQAGITRMQQMMPENHLYPTGTDDFRGLYRKTAVHFIGETGPFFYNAMSSSPDIVAREMPRARRFWDKPMSECPGYSEYHQHDGYFCLWKDRTQQQLRKWFGREFSIEKWEEVALGINIVVADLFKFAIEYSRSHKWRKTGVLWWSLLDMWPMMFNYSVVDYHFRKKQPTYAWIRQSQQPVCLMLQESADRRQLVLYAANDTLADCRVKYRVYRVDEAGKEKELWHGTFAARRNATTTIKRLPAPKTRALWVLEWELPDVGGKKFNHHVTGRAPYAFAVFQKWCTHLERLYETPSRSPAAAAGTGARRPAFAQNTIE